MSDQPTEAPIPPHVNAKLWKAALEYAETQGQEKGYCSQDELQQYLKVGVKTARKYRKLIQEYSTLNWDTIPSYSRKGKPRKVLRLIGWTPPPRPSYPWWLTEEGWAEFAKPIPAGSAGPATPDAP